jgi:tetratricopeptide (TPR) repeat protein
MNSEYDKSAQSVLNEFDRTNMVGECNHESVSERLNRIALEKHHLLQKPNEAVQLHLRALQYNVELITNVHVDNIDLKQEQQLALDITVTLIDIGNCFWSMGEWDKSRNVYFDALCIYNLMNIDLSFVSISIYNRLGKLDRYQRQSEMESNVESIINKKKSTTDSFDKSLEIIKDTISSMTTA